MAEPGMKIGIVVLVGFLRAQHPFPFQARILVMSSAVETSLDLPVLQHLRAQIFPMWIQSTDELNFLRPRSLLQLRFSSNRITNIAVMLVIDQLIPLILRSEPGLGTLSMLPGSA